MVGGRWTFFMGGSVWLGVSGGIFWVDGGWVDIFYGWVGVGGGIFWVGGHW